jgi:hypothetical protein
MKKEKTQLQQQRDEAEAFRDKRGEQQALKEELHL